MQKLVDSSKILTEDEIFLIGFLASLKIDESTVRGTILVLHKTPKAVSEMLDWVYDNKPTKAELLGKLAELGNAIQRGDYPTQNT